MTFEQIRTDAHALAKDVHELDVDRQQAEVVFATRLEALSTRANGLAVAIQNYSPDAPPVAQTKIRFALHKYNNTRPTPATFDVYDLQRGFADKLPATAEVYLYTTIVRRPSDQVGLTQFLKPGLVPDAWCAHTPDGKVVTRTRGEGPEALINIAVGAWRDRAIPNIVAEVVRYNAAGLYVDEVDAWWKYTWPAIATTGAKEFKTETYWRSMWVGFLTELAAALHANDRKLWINLGADYDPADQWQRDLLGIVDAFNIEFYTGREGVAAGPTTTSDGWLSQGAFVAAVEQSGTPVHVHSSSLDQRVTDYAFCSWLLHTEFLGSFSASRDYGGDFAVPSEALRTKALSLGAPTGKRVSAGDGFSRPFEHGMVTVTPSAMSGLIELR